MDWKGKWRNQYGSTVDITDDTNHRIAGTFKTALQDSGSTGRKSRSSAFTRAIASASSRAARRPRAMPRSRDGKMETMWFVVADAAIKAAEEGAPGKIEKLSWWRSIITSADTFERVVR